MQVEKQPRERGLRKILKDLFMPYLSEKEKLIEILNDNYSKELVISKMMEEHSEIIPFDFLKEKLKRLSEEEKTHAEKLKQKIIELGGTVNPKPKIYDIRTSSIHSERGFRKLIVDLEFDKEIYEDYIAQINKIEDEGIRELLREIIEDEIRHKDILMDIVMRLC